MYTCKNCGGSHVESLSWVDLNSGEVDNGDDVGEYYCRDCSAHTDVEYKQPSIFEEDLKDDVTVHVSDKPKIKEIQ